MTEVYLVDKSALARAERDPTARAAFLALDEAGLLATCAVIDLEIGYSARSPGEYESMVADRRDLYVDLPITRSVTQRAKAVQRQLAVRSQHRAAGIADLLVAACAELNDAVVVHYDRDYEAIAAVTGQPVRWLVPPVSIS